MKYVGIVKNWLENVVVRNWLKKFWGLISYLFLTIFIIVWLAYTIFLLKSDPQLANAYVAISTLILALVTSLLVGLTWITIRRADKREKHDRKAEVLDEIMNWLEEIYTIPLMTHIPLIGSQEELNNLKINTLNKYGVSIAKGLRIRAITNKNLSREFLTEINAFMGVLVQFTFLKGKLIEIDLKDTFVGDLRKAIEEIETEITKGKKTIDELHNDYALKLTSSIAELQYEVAGIKASLLK